MSYEDLEVELDLLDLENCRLEIKPNKSRHPNVMAIKATYLTVPDEENLAETCLLPMIYYTFKDINVVTTIFLDKGSNTSLITTKIAEALHLEGKIMLTMILKAGEEIAQPVPHKHNVIVLEDQDGKKHKVKCIEVLFITSVQE